MNADPTTRALAALSEQLLRDERRIATVESCTGGGIAARVTGVPGSSRWFERGFVTYSNAAKREMVGVPGELIQAHGAVSVEVAAAMAQGGLRFSHAHYCVAVTGVAGPGGGSAVNPVGTVCFGWASSQQTRTARRHFPGDRHAIREQTIAHALAGLLGFIRG